MLYVETVDGGGFIRDASYLEEDPCCRTAVHLRSAALAVRPVHIIYTGGSTPGFCRTILPALICDDLDWCGLSCYAWCAEREATRLFLVERITAIHELPDSNSFPLYQALGDLYAHPEPEWPQKYLKQQDRL